MLFCFCAEHVDHHDLHLLHYHGDLIVDRHQHQHQHAVIHIDRVHHDHEQLLDLIHRYDNLKRNVDVAVQFNNNKHYNQRVLIHIQQLNRIELVEHNDHNNVFFQHVVLNFVEHNNDVDDKHINYMLHRRHLPTKVQNCSPYDRNGA